MFPKIELSDIALMSVGILTYIFIYYGIRKERGVGQSSFTWILWILLDVSLIIPTYQKGGMAPLMLLLTSLFGSIFISFYLFKTGRTRWGKNEYVSLFLVIVVFVFWFLSEYGTSPIIKDKNIVIALGVASQVIAGWPLTIESWKKPKPIYILGYIFFIFSCILSLFLKKNAFENFVIEEHLFPLLLGVQTIVDVIPLIIKWLNNHHY